jgi:hypothetical protein
MSPKEGAVAGDGPKAVQLYIIAFSKDRPFQLREFLGSLEQHVLPFSPAACVAVIYTVSADPSPIADSYEVILRTTLPPRVMANREFQLCWYSTPATSVQLLCSSQYRL